jgi:hypothetical protein
MSGRTLRPKSHPQLLTISRVEDEIAQAMLIDYGVERHSF